MTEEIISRGSSPRLPRSDKQEEPKFIFGPSVLTPTSYASCSIRIGAYARRVLSFDLEALDSWYGVKPLFDSPTTFSIARTSPGKNGRS